MEATLLKTTAARAALLVTAALGSGSAASALRSGQDDEVLVRHDTVRNDVRLAVTDESFWGEWRRPYARDEGYWSVNFFANDDDDVAVSVGVVRTSMPSNDGVRLGVGLEAYVISLDTPDDEVYAVALTGMASYTLPTSFPTTVSAEVAYAPDVTTFDGADGVFDFSLEAELEISRNARAFVGYRKLELDLPGGAEYEPQDSFYIGIGLGL